jgi:hypothetical protein
MVDERGETGIDFVRAARARGSAAPVVLMSRVMPEILQILSLQAGAVGWWRKGLVAPGDLHRLLVAAAADPGPIGRLRLRQLRVRARACLTDDVAETAAVVHMTAKLVSEALGAKGASVSALAKELGIARSTLEAYAPLARWPDGEIEKAFCLGGKGGKRLSTSHLLAVSALPFSEAMGLLREAIASGWSVKVLRETIGQRRTAR